MPERVLRNSSYLNGRSTTGTNTRVRDVSSVSGMCPICIRNCPVMCEISLSAFRGRESLYPEPIQYGFSTSGSLKDYGLDWSHFNIQSGLFKVGGIESNPNLAFFENVDTSTTIGGVSLRIPIFIGAFGSTEVARLNWSGLAIGAALSGVGIIIGENVGGMDPKSVITNGKLSSSEELKRRVETFREFWDGKNGEVVVQTNVEDQRLSVSEYALSKLEVNIIERKWGQGAKAIGGEVRVRDLNSAIMLKKRGYLVIPNPENPTIRESFRNKVFESFERHSRVGIPESSAFQEDVDRLRSQGARQVFLKTGGYRPSAIAYTLKIASEAKIDAVTFDGAGGGTGMSPVPMMNEMSIPTVYLEALVLRCVQLLKNKGKPVPDIIMAGGFINETQVFKSLAMSNLGDRPYVKGVLMARSPLTAVMKSSYFVQLSRTKNLPRAFVERYGTEPDTFFVATPQLKEELGKRFKKVPWEAVGLYSYLNERIRVGLKQIMAGSRRWCLNLLDRSDIMALTERAYKVTGIPLAEDVDKDLIEEILE